MNIFQFRVRDDWKIKGGPQIKRYIESKKKINSFTLVRKKFFRHYIEFPDMPKNKGRKDGTMGLKIKI